MSFAVLDLYICMFIYTHFSLSSPLYKYLTISVFIQNTLIFISVPTCLSLYKKHNTCQKINCLKADVKVCDIPVVRLDYQKWCWISKNKIAIHTLRGICECLHFRLPYWVIILSTNAPFCLKGFVHDSIHSFSVKRPWGNFVIMIYRKYLRKVLHFTEQ